MTRLSRALKSAALPGALGVVAALGQAPLGFWWATLVALAFLGKLVAGQEWWRGRLWTGWTAGVGYFAASLFWIVEPFMVDAARDGWMAPFALVFMAGGMALFWALAAALAGLGCSFSGRAVGFALGLAASDLVRSYVFTGFPWALVGHVWAGTPVAQAAALGGPIGLSLLTAMMAALPVVFQKPRWAGLAISCGVLAVLWSGGAMRLAEADPAREPAIRVRLVQPNATQSLKWDPQMRDEFMRRQMEATAAPQAAPLDLVIWPETAVPWLLEDSADVLREIVAASGGVPVALGIQRAEGERSFNSLVATDREGAVSAVYDKHHLVPFGEYVPFGDVLYDFGISAFAAKAGMGYTAGHGAAVLDLGNAGKVLPLICYEAVFPQDLRAAPMRADWILQITNDGWFGNLAGPYQHLAQARLRAIEQGLPLMRVANTGVTAVIDAKGRVLQSLPLNTVGFLDADVPSVLPPTLYARTGDLPATMVTGIGLLMLAFVRRRKAH